jgi:hypothetical protein
MLAINSSFLYLFSDWFLPNRKMEASREWILKIGRDLSEMLAHLLA